MGNGADDDVWGAYAGRVKPLKGVKARIPEAPKPTHGAHKVTTRAAQRVAEVVATSKLQAHDPLVIAIEKHIDRSITRGNFEAQATIDLHGKTHDTAKASLIDFVFAQRECGHRRLIVITGGDHNRGVLRASIQQWVKEPPLSQMVLALRPAAIKQGGSGAWCMILRKSK